MPAKRQSIAVRGLIAAFFLVSTAVAPSAAQRSADRVIVVTLDGMRWQEIFGGADRRLMTSADGGVADTALTLRRFWRDDPDSRRRAVMPFLNSVVAERGLLLGDSANGSRFQVANDQRFSYPGYNELFTGAADPRITSNDKNPNPNVTVLEWLAGRPGFRGSIEAFGSWDVFPFIFNTARSRLPVNADGPPFPAPTTAHHRATNRFAERLPNFWGGVRLDASTMAAALDALVTRGPRVLVVLLGETDEWAHERRYDLYLDAARRADQFIQQLWEAAQASPAGRGRTSLVIATDHGRGPGRDWTDHGVDVPPSDRIWMAVMGPKIVPNDDLRRQSGTQSQFAATIAMLVGESWQSARPGAAAPLRIK